MVVEYARNKLRISDAGHAESDASGNPVISMLSCSLKGQEEQIFIPDRESWLFHVFQSHTVTARYSHCVTFDGLMILSRSFFSFE